MPTGLGDPAAGIVQPRAADLIGLPDNLVQQKSTDRLADAFRQGFVTADDIMNRVDNRARAKRKAEEQLYQEQLSPAAVEARAAVREAEKLEANRRAQEAEMDLEDQPFKKRIRRLEAARKIAESESFGTINGIANVMTLVGEDLPVRLDPDTGTTVVDVARAREKAGKVNQYLRFMGDLTSRRDQIKIGELKSGKFTERNWMDEGGLTPPGEQSLQLHKKLGNLLSLSYQQWQALGEPSQAQDLSGVGGTTSQATPSAQSLFPSATPAPQTGGAAAPAPAQAGAPTEYPAPQLGGVGPTGGIIVQTPGEGGEPGTEVQTRAKGALGRFNTSYNIIEALEQEGFDPTSVWTWANAMFPEILKTGNNKAWESAREAWAQGVLRYESGAAITPHEQKWYTEAFFPKVRDPQWVVDHKAKLRNDMERIIAEVANSGGAATPATREFAAGVMQRAEQLAGWAGSKGSKDPEKLGFNKLFRADGTVVWEDPKTKQRFEADTNPTVSAAPAAAQPTAQAPSPVSPLVQPIQRPHRGYISRPTPEPAPNPWLETIADIVNPMRPLQKKMRENQAGQNQP